MRKTAAGTAAQCFIGKRKFKKPSGSVSSSGNEFYSYTTCIAAWADDIIVYNGTRYSVTTSKHQSALRVALSSVHRDAFVVEVNEVPIGAGGRELIRHAIHTIQSDKIVFSLDTDVQELVATLTRYA